MYILFESQDSLLPDIWVKVTTSSVAELEYTCPDGNGFGASDVSRFVRNVHLACLTGRIAGPRAKLTPMDI